MSSSSSSPPPPPPQKAPPPKLKFPPRSILKPLRKASTRALALVGIVSLSSLVIDYKLQKDVHDWFGADDAVEDKNTETTKQEKKKKHALVLPFHRMKIVERKQPSLQQVITNLRKDKDDEDGSIIEVELNELLNVIHKAALDPNIVALYGTFGSGYRFASGGYAHVEEIRNAIQVFNESHREHYEPTVDKSSDDHYTHEEKEEEDDVTLEGQNQSRRQKKFSYAFADTFDHPIDSGNKEYYLASAFTNVYMQEQGNLNLYGIGMSSPFLRGMLDKYGIKVHVFRHGKYKNAPDIFMESDYTDEHRENKTSMIQSIDEHLVNSIINSRCLHNVSINMDPSSKSRKSKADDTMADRKVWENLRDYGTLTGDNAIEVGLIDKLCEIDPLDTFLHNAREVNKKKTLPSSKKKRKVGNGNGVGRNGHNNNIDAGSVEKQEGNNFMAEKKISLLEYSSLLAKKSKVEARKWRIREIMSNLSMKSSMTKTTLDALGYSAPNYNIDESEYNKSSWKVNKEKIAVVNITGAIDDSVARCVTHTLRKIKNDKNVKCVVMRVDSPGGSATASEVIHQECKHLPQPVVCSLSNTAASGGYYVAANCDRIFALPTTITGSIGVFGLKIDMSEFAASYGVNFDHISVGPHSTTMNPFQPLSKKMEINFNRNIDRVYDQFRNIVASGRKLDLDYVQSIAQGRVWTGEQAKEIGLVDELGGITRAISYAKRAHTSSGDADVEMWPKQKTAVEKLKKSLENTQGSMLRILWDEAISLVSDKNEQQTLSTFETDKVARRFLIETLINGGADPLYHCALLGSPMSGSSANIFLTMDETDAITLMLQDSFS